MSGEFLRIKHLGVVGLTFACLHGQDAKALTPQQIDEAAIRDPMHLGLPQEEVLDSPEQQEALPINLVSVNLGVDTNSEAVEKLKTDPGEEYVALLTPLWDSVRASIDKGEIKTPFENLTTIVITQETPNGVLATAIMVGLEETGEQGVYRISEAHFVGVTQDVPNPIELINLDIPPDASFKIDGVKKPDGFFGFSPFYKGPITNNEWYALGGNDGLYLVNLSKDWELISPQLILYNPFGESSFPTSALVSQDDGQEVLLANYSKEGISVNDTERVFAIYNEIDLAEYERTRTPWQSEKAVGLNDTIIYKSDAHALKGQIIIIDQYGQERRYNIKSGGNHDGVGELRPLSIAPEILVGSVAGEFIGVVGEFEVRNVVLINPETGEVLPGGDLGTVEFVDIMIGVKQGGRENIVVFSIPKDYLISGSGGYVNEITPTDQFLSFIEPGSKIAPYFDFPKNDGDTSYASVIKNYKPDFSGVDKLYFALILIQQRYKGNYLFLLNGNTSGIVYLGFSIIVSRRF